MKQFTIKSVIACMAYTAAGLALPRLCMPTIHESVGDGFFGAILTATGGLFGAGVGTLLNCQRYGFFIGSVATGATFGAIVLYGF
ncbi:MAG TPA: hypothetical protein VHV77_07095 [Pirellulales bacterium]|jgi:hypothetical protein|nr:hypothetical protein [Pirellulales bacterium]